MVSNNVSCIILFMVSWQPGMIDKILKRLLGDWQGKFTLGQEHSVSNKIKLAVQRQRLLSDSVTCEWGQNMLLKAEQGLLLIVSCWPQERKMHQWRHETRNTAKPPLAP